MSSPSAAVPQPKPLTLAVILFPLVQPLDFIGPCDLLTPLSPSRLASASPPLPSPYSLEISYLSTTLDPVEMAGGLKVVPTMTYDEADGKAWDVILVPGGRGARPWLESNERARRWLGKEAGHVEKARWVITVCTGSWLLSSTGALSSHRATTNKAAFASCLAWSQSPSTSPQPNVEWIPKARYVVSGKFWTSSGVTAGMDVMSAWMDEVVGKEVCEKVRGVLEFSGRGEGEDEWAGYHG